MKELPAVGTYLFILLVAAVVSYATTPGVLVLSRKVGAVDIPDDRKVHAAPTPTMGGIALFLAFLAAFVVASSIDPFTTSFRPFLSWPLTEPLGIAVATTIIFVLGVVDDMKGLRAPEKLAGQVLAAGLVFISGVRLEFLPLGSTVLSLDPNISALMTIFWIVIVVNAVNLIDGLDGLAAGITGIAATAFFIYTYLINQGLADLEQQNAPLISIIIAGAALGFLRFNFNPARIFMGDSGSMTLGFLLASATVIGVGRTTTNPIPESLLFYLPLVIPVIVLALPILDTMLAVVRRARKGQHVFHADKEHLHHRLLELGHGHKQAVLIMYAWTAVFAGMILALSFVPSALVQLLFAIAALGIFLYTVLPRLARRSRPGA